MVVSFLRKTCGTFEKKTGRTFENRVVSTKIVKFLYLRYVYIYIYNTAVLIKICRF